MRILATLMAESDQLFDYLPVFSTLSNSVDLFQKCLIYCLPKEMTKNRYWTHIKNKETGRCFLLLVPIVGNLYVLIFDYLQYKEDLAAAIRASALAKKIENFQSRMCRVRARQLTGIPCCANTMGPAQLTRQRQLWAACWNNHLDSARKLLEMGIDPNFTHFGKTLLVNTCEKSSKEMVSLLISYGARVDYADRFGNTPFSTAELKGRKDIMQLLMERGGALKGHKSPMKQRSQCSSSSLIQIALEGIESGMKREAKKARNLEQWGPKPHTGMELLCGRITWPI